MSSAGSRLETRARSGDRSRSKRMGAVMETSSEEFPPALSRIARQEADTNKRGLPPSSQARTPSRIPQNPGTRKLASQVSSGRPPLTHETQSWGSTSSSSGRSATQPLGQASSLGDADAMSKHSRNVLRRKKSTLSQETAGARRDSRANSGRTNSSSSIPRSQNGSDTSAAQLDRGITDSPVEIQVARRVEVTARPAVQPRVIPELDRYREIPMPHDPTDNWGKDLLFRLATHDLPPPTPQFSGASSHSQLSTYSASPSTRFSESPGPGPYSRDTTPTSMSSQSPGLVAPMRLATSRAKQASPADSRPPVTRRPRAGSIPNEKANFGGDPQGLASVREALNSSSSNSTVRDGDKTKEKRKKKGLTPNPPNPPPRKSSQKFKSDSEDNDSPSKSARKPAQPVMRSPSPTKRIATPNDASESQFGSPQPRLVPPSRPSRDNTPDLYSQVGSPLPIIHSNLSTTNAAAKHQSNYLAPSSLPRSTTPSELQSAPQARDAPAPVPRPPSADRARAPSRTAEPSREPARTPSPNVGGFKSRFPIFSRRTKTAPEVPQVDKKDKLPRKGPAAGTGHEGYGRLGSVRRRSSNAAIPPKGLSGPVSSSDSLSSMQSNDPFLMERMNPVIIAGGEVVENRNNSTELARTDRRPSIDSRFGSPSDREDPRRPVRQLAGSRASAYSSRRPSDSSDSEALAMKSTLAFRRSVQRARGPDQAPMRLPKPIYTRGFNSPSVTSIDTAILSDDSITDPRPVSNRSRLEQPNAPRKLTKRPKSPRKWNLFGRSQSQLPMVEPKDTVESTVPAEVKVVQSKPMAFYTMMDSSEQEDAEDPNIKDILRDAELLPAPTIRVTDQDRRPSTSSNASYRQSIEDPPRHELLSVNSNQPRPATAPDSPQRPQVVPEAPKAATATRTGRPSRLPQVGRIPKVVTTRAEPPLSPRSFSRPFHRVSLQLSPTTVPDLDQAYVAKGPSPPRSRTPEPARRGYPTFEQGGVISVEDSTHQAEQRTEAAERNGEFLAFSPRKNSDWTVSSESSSSGLLSYAPHIAVVPGPYAPLAEDEVWEEYNDLIGEVPPSATSSHGIPFHLETYERKLAKKTIKALESPTIKIEPVVDSRDSVATGKALTSSSHFSADMTARINAAFRFGSDVPSTPFSVSEFVSGYGERNTSSMDISIAQITPEKKTVSPRKAAKESPERTSPNKISAGSPERRSRGSRSSEEETPLSQVNLRVGSMTVSKWLTFGHVLFSPAREDLVPLVGSLKRHSILVVDGLGNDDWSFYAAETYPAATFFNLSPRAPLPKEQPTSATFPMSPPNHHQVQYTSHLDKFPFTPGSFTTVVFRFPSAAPESHYRNIISEARRVLKPGGYIELAILDVDLNNMGNRSRRAVRRLKERITMRNPEINLSSTSDLMLRLLGKRGFTELKSCRVGVPVASVITNSSGSEGGKKDERSLAEMMNDETEMGDENINKMVSKVGRWWYNRCYETASGSMRSIWSDKSLLSECEEWGTSLKLTVCHARVPAGRGRVASF